ncbi:MAG: AAA family ATPase [Acidobacteriota bacterium]|nr:MAG: AAA family ATPase [Acidobacteriota bacterium]
MAQNSDGPRRLEAVQLAWSCPETWLPFDSTEELSDCEIAYGQPRAVDAIRLAARLRARGYNVFVAGPPGTGKTTTVRRVLEGVRQDGPPPDDLCYVHNFDDPRSPRLLRVPAGSGAKLRQGLESAVQRFREGLDSLRSSRQHRERRQRVARGYQQQQSQLIQAFQSSVEDEGFALVEVSLGQFTRHELAPVVEGNPVAMQELDGRVSAGEIRAEQAEQFRKQHPALAARLSETTSQLAAFGRQLQKAVEAVDRDAARPVVDDAVALIGEAAGVVPGEREQLDRYLEQVQCFLLELFPSLYAQPESVGPADGESSSASPLDLLRINVIVDRSEESGRPIVDEPNPTPARLCGVVEAQRMPDGSARADLDGIRAGALERADGGYLILHARELLSEESAWPVLRRTMLSGSVSKLPANPLDGPPLLRPEPTDLDVTVVLIGTIGTADALARTDEEFGKLFKVSAFFDDHVPLSEAMVFSYACFLARVIKEEKLLHVDRGGVGRLMEYMVRWAGHQRRLSTRYRHMLDLTREAGWFAQEEGRSVVERTHVERALTARRAREAFLSERILDAVRDDKLQLEVDGARSGQVNGLAVVETSLERLGYPVRITATTAVGQEGIIDVEREAELSGEIHTKASLILAGYLRSQFATRLPLAITASICFEQSYGGVEGDSASSAELAALLSALAEHPLRQDLAVTGAIDQHGQVLAVGGINEKVEGFWRICSERGLTGRQGVIIPVSCITSLQLEPRLVEDVRAERFHVYAIRRVSGMMELLTGLPFGEPGADGQWPEGSLGRRIAGRLAAMSETLRRFGHRPV